MMDVINTRKRLDEDLSELKRMVFRMARMSGEALENAVWALKNRDEASAREVLEKDDLIDDLEDKIDEACMEFAARYQPLGEDLRTVTSIMHMAVDLERIGDYGGNIAKTAIDRVSRKGDRSLPDG